jgi:hypothetical protein
MSGAGAAGDDGVGGGDTGGSGGEGGLGTGGNAGGAFGGEGGEGAVSGSGGSAGEPPVCELNQCGAECVDTAIEEDHCGGCDRECVVDTNTTAVTCGNGFCAQTCGAGFGDCVHPAAPAADDGCETNFNDSSTCGTACGNVVDCLETETCLSGVCTPIDNCEQTTCGTDCVDLDVGMTAGNTANHCGSCDHSCSVQNASVSVCTAGECNPTCDVGFDDCDPDDGIGSDNGCETELAVGTVAGQSVDNCGVCGRDCSLTNALTASCDAGVCEPSCAVGFADCVPDDGNDGNGADDGCETGVTDTTNCGACGHACSATNASGTACTAGACAPTCNEGFLDCNVNGGAGADDGCETPNNTTASCGATCAEVADCELGAACTPSGCEATGLAVFTIPFTAAAQIQRYSAVHATERRDLTGDVLHVRLYAPGATAGSVTINLFDNAGPPGVSSVVDLTTLNSGWVTLSIPVPAATADWNPAETGNVNFDVSSGTTGPWANPTIIYVDRIWSNNHLRDDRFVGGINPPMQRSTTASASLAGSTLDWLAALPP